MYTYVATLNVYECLSMSVDVVVCGSANLLYGYFAKLNVYLSCGFWCICSLCSCCSMAAVCCVACTHCTVLNTAAFPAECFCSMERLNGINSYIQCGNPATQVEEIFDNI